MAAVEPVVAVILKVGDKVRLRTGVSNTGISANRLGIGVVVKTQNDVIWNSSKIQWSSSVVCWEHHHHLVPITGLDVILDLLP